MAVDSKLGETKLGTGANGAHRIAAGPTNGTTIPVVAEGTKRLKRSSSLRDSATSLPKVEHSLDEFIARANQTLVDVSAWGTADQQAKDADEKRREQDALRWKQAEAQMRDSAVREQSLRGQLDGLQGRLAEAEARVAVALSTSGAMPAVTATVLEQDKAIDDLRAQIAQAQQRVQASEHKSRELAKALELAKTEVSAQALRTEVVPSDDHEGEERIRIAEAKAAKALAAARAAAAGLTVSSADLAAIESGLAVAAPLPERRTPWIAIMLAFAGGLGIMFLVWKFALNKPESASTAAPAQAAVPPAAAEPAQAAPAPAIEPDKVPKPSVSPIDDKAAAAPIVEPIVEPKPAAGPPDVKAEPIEIEVVKPAVVKPAPVPVPVKAPIKHAAPAPVAKPAVTAPAAAKPAAVHAAPKKPVGKPGIADPFADPPAKKPAAPKKAGKIVDPFAS